MQVTIGYNPKLGIFQMEDDANKGIIWEFDTPMSLLDHLIITQNNEELTLYRQAVETIALLLRSFGKE